MDLSQLSKDELIRLLKERGGEKEEKAPPSEALDFPYGKCQFMPTRGLRRPCDKPAISPIGFCNTHKNTVQSKYARQRYEEERKVESEKKVEDNKGEESKKIEKPEKSHVSHEKKSDWSSPYEPRAPPERYEKTKVRQQAVLRLRKNRFGHFEHEKTHVVFDPLTKKACGVQRSNGVVTALRKKHIDLCRRYGWSYELTFDSDSEPEEDKNGFDEDTEGSGNESN